MRCWWLLPQGATTVLELGKPFKKRMGHLAATAVLHHHDVLSLHVLGVPVARAANYVMMCKWAAKINLLFPKLDAIDQPLGVKR